MADGSTIQLAGQRALKEGMTLQKTLDMAKKFRLVDDVTPIVLMGYYNPIYSYGVEKFLQNATQCGIDGLIIVDLPYVESEEFLKKLNEEGIDLIRLISPTTTNERIRKILTSSSGYLYYISLKGVTGSDLKVSDELEKRVSEIKNQTNLPVVVGFGIKDAETAKKMSMCSDGVVVGSKLVDEISKHSLDKDNLLKENLTSIIGELREGIS